MARDVSNFIRIAIPVSVLRTEPVHDAVKTLTAAAGGGTSWSADGAWFDSEDNLHSESVRVFVWNFHTDDYGNVDAAARQLVERLFEAGEKAVLKERNYDLGIAERARTVPGYAARMLFAPTKH